MLPIRLPSSVFANNQQSGSGSGRLQPHVVPQSPTCRHSNGDRAGQSSPNSAHSSSGTATTRNSQIQVKPFTKASLDKKSRRNRATIRDYGFVPRNKLSIQDGAILPQKYEPFPNTLYGKALEEIDQFIYDETFCVVSKRFRKNYIHRFTATESLFFFSAWGYLRRTCIFISTNQYFDYMVMATILLNCVFLAKTESVEEAEYIFLAIYTAEMIIKIVAKGFVINKYTYLRNPWNWLDFIVIASGYATIGMEVGNLAGLRTFRVLRALKTVSIMPGLKTIINALLHSFKQLAEVMTLTIFCLMVFALFALQVYMGELRNKCVGQYNGTGIPELDSNQSHYGREWNKWINNDRHWLLSPDNEPVICGNVTGARKCPAGFVCLKAGENPNHGYTNFDNFLWSMLTTFQLITLDYWENVYNMVLASSGPLSVVFFTVVVFFGSFYLINLMLAVVALSYEEEAEITQEERRKDLTDHRDDSTFSFDPTKIPVKKLDKNNMKKIDSKKGILLSSYSRKRTRRRKRRGAMAVTGNESVVSGANSRSGTPSPEPDTPPEDEEDETEANNHDNRDESLPVMASHRVPPPPTASSNNDNKLHPDNALGPVGVRINRGQLSSRQASSNASEGNNRSSSMDDSGVVDDHEDGEPEDDVNQSHPPVTPSSVVLQKITERMKVPPSQRLQISEEQTDLRLKKKCNGSIQQIYTLPTSADYMNQVVVLDNLVDRNCAKCPECCIDYESWLRFQNCLYRIVRDPLFELLITVCIILNTMFLAVEHHGMSESMRYVLDVGNKVFTLVFTLECIMKVMALSNDYFQCGWNIFDLIVVTASLVDLMTEFVDGLSVLRGLRLLRVLKLAQSWTTMKVLLSIIISTIGALGNLTFVLVIVIYIFAVIGMQLFSKDYTSEKFAPDPVPRWNFSDFFHSFMMIFRILCGEWIEPLWDCMRAEEYQQGSGTCFAIFLPALVMGNFMVLNLFLALLLNSFNSDELKSKKEEVGEGSKLARSLVRLKSIMGKNRKHFGTSEELKDNNANLQLENLVREVLQNKNSPKPPLTEETLFSTDNELDGSEVPPNQSPPLYISSTSVAPPNLSSSQLSLYRQQHHYQPMCLKSPTLSAQSLSQLYNAHLVDTSQNQVLTSILKPSKCCCIHSQPQLSNGQTEPTNGCGHDKRKGIHTQETIEVQSPSKVIPKSRNNIFRTEEITWKDVRFTGQSSKAIKSFKDRLKAFDPKDQPFDPDPKSHKPSKDDSCAEIVNEKSTRLPKGRVGKRSSLNNEDVSTRGLLPKSQSTSSKRFSVPLEPFEKTDSTTLVHTTPQSIVSSNDKNSSSVITNLIGQTDHQNRASSSQHAVHSIPPSTTTEIPNLPSGMFNTPVPAQKTAQDVRDDPKDHIPSSEQLPRLPTFEQSLRESCSKEILRPIPQRPSLEGGSQRSSLSVSKSPHRRQSVIHQSPSLHQIAHQQNICCCQFQFPSSTSTSQMQTEQGNGGNGDKFIRTYSEDNKHSESYNEELEADILKRYDSLDNTDYAFRQDDLYQRIMREAMLAAPTLSSSHLDLPNFDELYTEGDDEFRDYCEGVMSYRRQGEDGSTKSQHRRSYMLATKQISSDSQEGDDAFRAKSSDPLTAEVGVKKPWVALVSYVDELTVGGRRDSQGHYIDGLGSFPGFGRDVTEKDPEDCFPEHCYQRCPCCHDIVQTLARNSYWVGIRRHILYIVEKPIFEWFILVLIFASSLTLCFEDIYLDSNPPLKRILYWVNLVFSVIFTIEMIFKWIALGFYKYFGAMWTLLDFFIVFVSVVSLLIEENENLKVLRSLRTLRALRPLRAISKWQGMRIVVNALMYAIPSIFNVLLVCLVFWLIFSIMGVQFFGGKFYKCLDENDELLPVETVNDKFECLAQNYTWINSKITFDNVGDAYLALFQVATFEGWMEVMADAVDARGVDQQPQYEANLYAYIYFVIFIVCGSFFTLNLFIGVIIDNFNMLKKKYEGGVLEMFLTESQKHYYTAMKKLGRKKPQKVIKRPLNQFLAMFYDLSNSRRFEIAIFVLIFLNMLSMGIEHYDQNQVVFFVLEVSNAFFTTVFSLEALVKIIGLRYHYFTVPWNLFDFLLVLASILGILMEDIMIDFPVSPTLLRVVRVFRIGRILRLIKAAKGIRKLLFALVVSLPALFNIGALLGLITFIYAIIGMSVFGHVRHQRALDDMVNFETFGRSMQLLFRLMTSAGWNDVLESLMIQPPDCDINHNNVPNGDCGYPLLAITYFTSFIIISYMIVINMYIAIILENFNQAHQEEEIGIVEDDLEMFYIRWSKYDPHATQFISFSQLADFIASLDPPLGIPKPNIVALVSFNLPIAKGNKIHCLDILHALVKHVLGHVEETEDFRKLQDQMDVKFKKQFPTRKELEIVSSTRLWKRQDKAARMIQRCYRDYKRRRKEAEAAQALEEDDEITHNSSPGGWQGRLSAFLHVHRGSRASSRKSSRASDAGSDASEVGAAVWLNLPLFLLTGGQTQNGDDGLKPGNDVCITVSNPSPETVLSTFDQDFTSSHLTSPPGNTVPAGFHDSLDLPEATGVEITVTEPSPDQDTKRTDIVVASPCPSRQSSLKRKSSIKSSHRSSIKSKPSSIRDKSSSDKASKSAREQSGEKSHSSSSRDVTGEKVPKTSTREQHAQQTQSPSMLKRANTESCPPASVRRAIFRRSSEAAIGSGIVAAGSTIVQALVHRESEENESNTS